MEETKETLLNNEGAFLGHTQEEQQQVDSDESNEEYNFKNFQDLIQQIEYLSKQDSDQIIEAALSSDNLPDPFTQQQHSLTIKLDNDHDL